MRPATEIAIADVNLRRGIEAIRHLAAGPWSTVTKNR